MEAKNLVVLALLILSSKYSSSQSISCRYDFVDIGLVENYVCFLSIDNPNGVNDFTSIDGTHLEGLSSVNVTAILRQYDDSTTLNVPQIICSEFHQVTYMDLSVLNIQILDENSFRGCEALDSLRLYGNRINALPENLFSFNRHLGILGLEYNTIQTIPENLFEQQENLEHLSFVANPIETLPGGVFRNLINLNTLSISGMLLSTINPQWFENLINLEVLDMSFNPLTAPIPGNAFQNLVSLQTVYLASCNIMELNFEWFQNTLNLQVLLMYENELTSLPSNAFSHLTNLLHLDFGTNRISDIASDAFVNLNSIQSISLSRNQIRSLHPQLFANLTTLRDLYLSYNSITSLPDGVFSSLNNLQDLSLWMNDLRTLNRNAFGFLGNIVYMDFEANNINALDERVLSDATNLFMLYFENNLCASGSFYNFSNNREMYIQQFSQCFYNSRIMIETTTQPDNDYIIFAGVYPGVNLLISSTAEVHISLTPFDFIWTPTVEIVIGANNNTRSRIVRNRHIVVAELPTPNILRHGEWTKFRITWARHIIMVYDDQDYPFLAYTLENVVPINYFGLRSPESSAAWIKENIRRPRNTEDVDPSV